MLTAIELTDNHANTDPYVANGCSTLFPPIHHYLFFIHLLFLILEILLISPILFTKIQVCSPRPL